MESHKTTSAYEHRCDKLRELLQSRINDIGSKYEMLESRLVEKRAQVQTAEERERELRRTLQLENEKNLALITDTTEFREKVTSLQSELDRVEKEVVAVEAETKGCIDQHNAVDDELVVLNSDHQVKLVEHSDLAMSLDGQVAMKRERDAELQRELHDLWRLIINSQIAHGQEPSAAPEKSTTAPQMNLTPLRQALESEKASFDAESQATNDLEATLTALRQQEKTLKAKFASIQDQAESCIDEYRTESDKQKQRRRTLEKFVSEHQESTKIVHDLRREAERHRDALAEELATLQAESASLEQVNKVAERDVQSAERQLEETAEQLDEAKKQTMELLVAKEAEESQLEGEIEHHEREYALEIKELDGLEEDQDSWSVSEETCVDDVKAQIEKILRGTSSHHTHDTHSGSISPLRKEFPVLETIDIGYNAGMSAEEQTSRDLKQLYADCKQRIASAQKMANDLREAQETALIEQSKIREADQREADRISRVRSELQKKLASSDRDRSSNTSVSHRKSNRDVCRRKNRSYDEHSDMKPRKLHKSFSQVQGQDPLEGTTSRKHVTWSNNMGSQGTHKQLSSSAKRTASTSASTSSAKSPSIKSPGIEWGSAGAEEPGVTTTKQPHFTKPTGSRDSEAIMHSKNTRDNSHRKNGLAKPEPSRKSKASNNAVSRNDTGGKPRGEGSSVPAGKIKRKRDDSKAEARKSKKRTKERSTSQQTSGLPSMERPSRGGRRRNLIGGPRQASRMQSFAEDSAFALNID